MRQQECFLKDKDSKLEVLRGQKSFGACVVACQKRARQLGIDHIRLGYAQTCTLPVLVDYSH